MRGWRFYGGGSGFLLCFAAERKRCAPESLLQLPPPFHTLREKDTVQHNGNRAVTAFLASHTLLREKVAVRPDFLHCLALCTALLSARSAMPCARKFAAVLSNNLHIFAGRRLCVAGGFTAEGLDFCFALRQKGNVVRPKACYNCRPRLTRFCGKRILYNITEIAP